MKFSGMLLLILLATSIGQEEIPPSHEGQSRTVSKNEVHPHVSASSKKPLLRMESTSKIDRNEFLKLFSEQANQQDLRSCMKLAEKSELGRVTIGASLEKSGKLINPRLVDAGKTIPKCALEIFEQMNFKAITSTMSSSHHTVYWTFEW